MRSPAGFLLAISAFLFWGFTPVYWNLIRGVEAPAILGHRILWGFVAIWIVLAIRREGISVVLKSRRVLLRAILASVLIGVNWFVYLLAVSSGRILDASLGYYINPLVSVFLGVLVLREKLGRVQIVALIMAISGVVFLTVAYGSFPWISLTLAGSFGVYGLVKKRLPVSGPAGLATELTFLLPVGVFLAASALIAGLSPGDPGAGASAGAANALGGAAAAVAAAPAVSAGFGTDAATTLVLIGAGLVTVIPLLLFVGAAKRLDLSAVGFFQYIAPTTMLLLGTLVYGEPFPTDRLVGFLFVWAALGLYTASLLIPALRRRRRKPSRSTPY